MSQLPIKRYFYQVQNETENSMSAPRPRPSNRDLLRSGGNRQHHKKYYKEIQTMPQPKIDLYGRKIGFNIGRNF